MLFAERVKSTGIRTTYQVKPIYIAIDCGVIVDKERLWKGQDLCTSTSEDTKTTLFLSTDGQFVACVSGYNVVSRLSIVGTELKFTIQCSQLDSASKNNKFSCIGKKIHIYTTFQETSLL